MSVSFKDYYAVLGVDREASETEIKKAYRQKARELHPDVNQSPQAAEQFRDVNEAYEVLSDPEKRQRYDRLGSAWKHGAPFEPPPGFEGIHFDVGDLGDIFSGMRGAQHGDRTGFSDFFESLFGDLGVRFGGPFGESAARRPARGRDIEAEIEFVLGDLLAG
ncbi:MAG: DnaJ domain-containing protein, partial [Acidobacteriota bacterium]